MTITPIVSGDEQVTLSIDYTQSGFTGKISETAPPGTQTKTFKSMIRVKNGEMILLGGLEEKSKDKSGSGIPFLSRIPIIKFFFSSRSEKKEKSKSELIEKRFPTKKLKTEFQLKLRRN